MTDADLHERAIAILANHGLTGGLMPMSQGRWLLRGIRGRHGAAAEIEGDPDEAVLNEAAGQIVRALADVDFVGR
jgi:hypothetical protein